MALNCRIIILSVFLIIVAVITFSGLPGVDGAGGTKRQGPDACTISFSAEICKAKYTTGLIECAKKLPENERKVAFGCSEKMCRNHNVPASQYPKTWVQMCNLICGPKIGNLPDPPERGNRLVACFDHTLNQTVQAGKTVGNGLQYPQQFFACRNKLMRDSCNELKNFQCKNQFGCIRNLFG